MDGRSGRSGLLPGPEAPRHGGGSVDLASVFTDNRKVASSVETAFPPLQILESARP